MAKAIVDYAQKHTNVDYLHVWLADGSNNHCECENCQKARPSDFYMMIMNELDELMTEKGLATRIVFIAYVDTLFAPEKVFINNPQRFSLLYAPITRSYTSSITEETVIPDAPDYVRNNWERPKAAEANLSHLRQWKKNWKGSSFSYEYHFWRQQYNDPGLMYISRRIYEDIRSLKVMGLDGFVEDGSQRSFFPNGFHIYIYAEALMNRNCDYDEVLDDYLQHIYGEAWKDVKEYLQSVTDIFDFVYMTGEGSSDKKRGTYFNPAWAEKLPEIKKLAARGKAIASAHLAMPTRPQTVSMRLLLRHAEYIEGYAEFVAEKAQANDTASLEKFEAFRDAFGRHEFEIERYFDHGLCFNTLRLIVIRPTVILQEGT